MKKQITVQTTGNQKYFTIYEVKAIKPNGEKVVYERELNKKAAERDLEIIHNDLSKLYTGGYIIEQIVWC